jgi:hypothetical protein
MAVTERMPETAAEARERRVAASRARMEAFLQDSETATQAAAAMGPEAEPEDGVVARARQGEFAEAAFIEGYGAELVAELKSCDGR